MMTITCKDCEFRKTCEELEYPLDCSNKETCEHYEVFLDAKEFAYIE